MAGNTVGSRIVLEGEKEYRQALKNIQTEQKELRSEMRLCSTEFKGQENSLEALTKKHDILERQITAQNNKIKLYTKNLEESKQAQEKAGEKVEQLTEQLQGANDEMEAMKASSDTSAEALEEQQKRIDELKKQLEEAGQEYQLTGQATMRWQTQVNDARADLNNMNEDLQNTERYMEEAQRSTDGCASSIDEYGRQTQEAAEQTSVFGEVLKANLAAEAIKAGITMIVDGIKGIAEAATSMGSSFEASMSQVAATMGMTVEEVEGGSAAYTMLADAAKECGKTTMFSASEAAEALNYLALAGYDAEKATKTLPKVLDLAAAGGMDLAYASDLVTDSMAALGLETDQLDNYIDEMARTSQKSNTSVAQLGEATLVCAGTVSLAKQNLETMNTELGVLANNGIKGAEGGTHLRNVILSLSSPTEAAQEAFREMGLQINDSNGSMRDLNDIMTDLNVATSSMTSSQKTQMIAKIFNKTDIAAVNALLKGTGAEYDNLHYQISNCSGAAADMAATLNNNLKGKVTILNSALEGLGISAYEIFDDDMKNAVDAATRAVGRLQNSIDNGDLGVSLNKMSEALGDFAEQAIDAGESALPVLISGLTWVLDHSDLIGSGIAGVTAATLYHGTVAPVISAVTAAWAAYKTANEGATISQWALNAAMSANPAGMLVTAIVGLTAAIGAFALTGLDAESAMSKLARQSRETVDALTEETQKRKDSTAANEAEIKTVQELKEELWKLNEKERLSAEEKTKIRIIVEELNQVMPELNLAINEQTGHLADNCKGWEKAADAMLAAMEAEFRQEDLTAIAKEKYEAEKQLQEVQEQRAEILEELAEAEARYTEASQNQAEIFETNGEVLQAATAKYNDLKAVSEEYAVQEEQLNEQIRALTSEFEQLHETIEESDEEIGESLDVIMEYGDGLIVVQAQSAETRLALEALSGEYAEAKTQAMDSINSQVSLFEELAIKSELSVGQMSANLQSQTEAFNQYKDDILKCSDLVEQGILDEGLLGSIQALGIDGAGYMHELAAASEEDIERVVESFEQMQEAKDSLASAIADMQIDYSDRMDELLGIQTDKHDLYKSNTEECNESIKTAVAETGEELTLKTEETMAAINNEIVIGTVATTASMNTLCTALVTAANTKFNIVDGKSLIFQEIGQSLPAGLAQGINNGTSEVENAITNLIDKMINKALERIEDAKQSIDRALGSALR